jgi:ubiquinone/menaquinone biosynthesis C-methylase UbiE
MIRNDYTSITELPASLLTPDQMRRFAHRYGYAQTLARGKHVLEVACGAGNALNYLATSAEQVVGLDTTGGVLISAQQNSAVPLAQSDAQSLPFAAEQFDLLLCFEAIYYLEEYRRFLNESQRVLRAGGRLLVCQSNPDWPNFAPGALTTYYPRLPELATSMTQAGFHDLKCYGMLPITATPARQKVVNALRWWVMKLGILPWLGPLKSLLQRMSYGQLYPLPPAIDAQWVTTWQADLSLTPLSPTQPDRVHRVVYVEGTR